jgi:EEF1A N-terminal glycine/lysine methyltransferase
LKSARDLLAPYGYILKTFSHHLPQHKQRALTFFDKALEMGFQFEEIYQEKWPEMFPKDGGDLEIRRTVHCFKLWLS